MSGPKGFGYEVVSAQELRRREDEARAGRCRRHVVTLAGLHDQLRRHGCSVDDRADEPPSTDRQSMIAWEEDLIRAIGAARERVREESAKEIMRRLRSGDRAVDVSGLSLGGGSRGDRSRPDGDRLDRGDRSAPDARAGAPPERDARRRVAADVGAVVGLLAGLRDPAVREELTATARAVLDVDDPAQARGDLLTLKTRATEALRVQDLRDLAAQEALALAASRSRAAADLRARAERVTTAAELSGLRGRIAELVEQERREADARFVQGALEEVLAELGFAVDEDFELQDYGAVGVASHASCPGYGVRFQVSPGAGTLFTRVVSRRESSPEEDARAEALTCDGVRAVADRLHGRGVSTELRFSRRPGEAAVERRIAPAEAAAEESAPRAAAAGESAGEPAAGAPVRRAPAGRGRGGAARERAR